MSSAGQIVGAVAGFAIGAWFGMPWLGMALGGMAGMYLDPVAPEKPSMDNQDMGFNTYTRDVPVSIIYGANKVYGQIIWIGDHWAEQVNEGSSKEPSWTTRYHASFAVAISEGEIQEIVEWKLNEDTMDAASENSDTMLEFTNFMGTGDQVAPDAMTNGETGTLTSGTSWSANNPNYRHTAFTYVTGIIGTSNTLPTLSSEVKGILVETGDSYPYDANPIRVLYDFLTNKRYGMGMPIEYIDGDCDTANTTFNVAAAYCDVYIDYSFEWTESDGTTTHTQTGTEPRFRYSNVFDSKTKGWDIVQDILQTCRGLMYFDNGKLSVKIERPDEQPVFYFCDVQAAIFSGSGDSNSISGNFSAYPDGFWDAAVVEYVDNNGVTYRALVIEQSSGSASIESINFTHPMPSFSGNFSLTKDCIKAGTFNYTRRGHRGTYNRVRVEYRDRGDNYRLNIAEVEDNYDIEQTGFVRETTVQMHGIKRPPQAARVATFLMDYNTGVKYLCEFETDTLGMYLVIGDIICITHIIPGWQSKMMRVIAIDEMDNLETKIQCIEYVPTIYGDSADSAYRAMDTKLPSRYIGPASTERLKLFVDATNSCIWITFKRPSNSPYYVSSEIWLQKGGGQNFNYMGNFGTASPSVELGIDLSDTATTIPYTDATMYDSFPGSGTIWIDGERITYTGIDDTNHQFTGCSRGTGGTSFASHMHGAFIVLQTGQTPKLNYTSNDIGVTWTMKAISLSTSNMRSNPAQAPFDSVIPR